MATTPPPIFAQTAFKTCHRRKVGWHKNLCKHGNRSRKYGIRLEDIAYEAPLLCHMNKLSLTGVGNKSLTALLLRCF